MVIAKFSRKRAAFPGSRSGILLLLVVMLSLALGSVGYFKRAQTGDKDLAQQCPPDLVESVQRGDIDDLSACVSYVAYNTLQLIVFGGDPPRRIDPRSIEADDKAAPIIEQVWELHVARGILGILSVYGALTILASASRRVRRWVPLLMIRTFRGHHIIVGLGSKGQKFATNTAAQGRQRIVGIDMVVKPEVDWLEQIGRSSWTPVPTVLRLWRQVMLIEGDARHPAVLAGCGIGRAAAVTVVCEADATNLEIVRAIQQLFKESTGDPEVDDAQRRLRIVREPLRVRVHVLDRSIRTEIGAQRFEATRRPVVFRYFSVQQLAARMFWQRYKLPYEADIRGQTRMHLALIGEGELAEEMLALTAVLWPYKKMTKPLVTMVAENPEAVRNGLRARYPGLCNCLDWRVLDAPLMPAHIGPHLLDAIEQEDESGGLSELPDQSGGCVDLTAIFVCTDGDMQNMAIAHRLRSLSDMQGRCRAPIYPYVWAEQDFSRSTAPCLDEARFSRVIQEFGLLSDVCGPEGTGRRVDALASAIQNAYIDFVKVAKNTGSTATFNASGKYSSEAIRAKLQGSASLIHVEDFETQRDIECEMNRMPALHLPYKLYSMGFAFPLKYEYRFEWPVRLPDCEVEPIESRSKASCDDGLRFHFLAMLTNIRRAVVGAVRSTDDLMALGDLEHKRWMNDRFLAGYRWGPEPRDDRRRFHPMLRDWKGTDEPEREKDVCQLLACLMPYEFFGAVSDTARARARARFGPPSGAVQLLREEWLGVIGPSNEMPSDVTKERVAALRRRATTLIETLLAQKNAATTQTILVTPLRPGSDTIFIVELFLQIRKRKLNRLPYPLVRCFVCEGMPRLARAHQYAKACALMAIPCDRTRESSLPEWIVWMKKADLREEVRRPMETNEYREPPEITRANALRLSEPGTSNLDDPSVKALKSERDTLREDLLDRWRADTMTFYEGNGKGRVGLIKPSREMPSLDWVIECYDGTISAPGETDGGANDVRESESKYLDGKCGGRWFRLLPDAQPSSSETPRQGMAGVAEGVGGEKTK